MLNVKKPCPIHGFSSNTYVISSAGEYAVIDPSVPYDDSLCPGALKYVLLTHSHFDHILDIDSWANTGAKVIVSEKEVDFLSDPMRNCYGLFFGQDKGFYGETFGVSEGAMLPLGEEMIEIIEVPGHTTGSLIYKIGDIAFVGDTVFAGGGYGRWDLPSGNYSELVESIERIKSMPDDMILYPGHGESTTVKQYKVDFKR